MPRRKCFELASRRISIYSESVISMSSGSQFDSSKRKNTPKKANTTKEPIPPKEIIPLKRSKRIQSRHQQLPVHSAASSSLNVQSPNEASSKRRTRSNKSKSAILLNSQDELDENQSQSNDTVNLDVPKNVKTTNIKKTNVETTNNNTTNPCRPCNVKLRRMNNAELNYYLEGHSLHRQISASQPVKSTVAPKKVKTRRCTVHLTRIDDDDCAQTNIGNEPAIKKIKTRRCTVDIEPIEWALYKRKTSTVLQPRNDDNRQSFHSIGSSFLGALHDLRPEELDTFYDMEIHKKISNEHRLESTQSTMHVTSQSKCNKTCNTSAEETFYESMDSALATTFFETDDNDRTKKSAVLSSDEESIASERTASTCLPSDLVRDILKNTRKPIHYSLGPMDFDSVDSVIYDTDEDSSFEITDQNLQAEIDQSTSFGASRTHFSRLEADDEQSLSAKTSQTSGVSSTYFSHGMVPITMNQMQSSQSRSYISWRLGASVSDISSTEESSVQKQITSSGEYRKCFIDSRHVKYGSTIEFKKVKFAVNCFDHGDEKIRHHFLSKFSHTQFSAWYKFNGIVHVTEITAQLLYKYSSIRPNQVRIMNYEKTIKIDGIEVTAIEVPIFPGGALFLFEAKDEKSIIHVGDHRLPIELDSNAKLINSDITEVQFDQSTSNGLSSLIAIGTFEIGMEFLLLRLVENFNCKIYMSDVQRKLLKIMDIDKDPDAIIRKLNRKIIDNSKDALIHVLPVEDIAIDKLRRYTWKHNFHRVLGIRPRSCDAMLQTVYDETHKIIDIANPLIGDIAEYERFVLQNTHTNISIPDKATERHWNTKE